MKKLEVLIVTMILFVGLTNNIIAKPLMNRTVPPDSIHLKVSTNLLELATQWASAFEKTNSQSEVIISNIDSDNLSQASLDNLYLVSNLDNFDAKALQLTVGRNIMVAVMNSDNPYLDAIFNRGLSAQEFADIYDGKIKKRGSILENNESDRINFYHSNNKINKSLLANFLKTNVNKLNETNIPNINDFINQIHKDKYSIGFCNLSDIVNAEKNELRQGLSFLPIDRNANGQIDFPEDIYSNLAELERSVWIGKYPKSLYANLTIIASTTNKTHLAFIDWIITDGQDILPSNGYSALVISESQSTIQKLNKQLVSIPDSNTVEKSNVWFIILLIAAVLIIPILLFKKTSPATSSAKSKTVSGLLNEETISIPGGLFFDKSHTWAFMEKDGLVRVGIGDFLQHITGKITNIGIKKTGEVVKKGEAFAILIQDGKQLSVSSPITGKVKEINNELSNNSQCLNDSPYSEGWLYLIEPVSWLNEIKSFFIANTYKEWLNEEFKRLRDFFSTNLKLEVNSKPEMVLQDGGALSDFPLEHLGPIIWEEFQTKFLDRKKK